MAVNASQKPAKQSFFGPISKGLLGFSKSFFVPVAKEWVDPPNLDEVLENEGFIVASSWDKATQAKYSSVVQDIEVLKKYLMPIFLSYNQRAKYYQNGYFFYQRIFIIGAFLTTILAVCSTYFSSGAGKEGLVGPLFGAVYHGPSMLELFSVLTTIVSAITGYFTILSQKGDPRKRWSNYRRLAEDLRMTYFKFLTHQAPYDQPNRIDVLRQNLYEIRQKGRGINA
jgi:hypothetical protein